MNINDDLIIEIFFKDDKYLHSRTKQSWLNKNIDIYNYLIKKRRVYINNNIYIEIN